MTEFTLQKWDLKYADDVVKNANNPAVAANLRNAFPCPYTYEAAVGYIKFCSENDEEKQCTRAIVVDGHAVGSIGFFIQDDVYEKNAEVGYWLGENYWRQGIMSEALKRICAFGFENYDIERIYAEPFADNKGSRGVLEKAGFTLEGELRRNVLKNGVFHNSCIYGLLKYEK